MFCVQELIPNNDKNPTTKQHTRFSDDPGEDNQKGFIGRKYVTIMANWVLDTNLTVNESENTTIIE